MNLPAEFDRDTQNRRPGRGHMCSRFGSIEAVLLDLDGTLYRPTPVQLAVMRHMLLRYAFSPKALASCIRAIRGYRKALEVLRIQTCTRDIETHQLEIACRLSGLPAAELQLFVQIWMEQAPLPILRRWLRPGLPQFIERARSCGLLLGIFSDYPIEQKLKAIGLTRHFDVLLTARQCEVNRLKPDPLGLELSVSMLGVSRDTTLYVGDRPAIDAEAASRAGVRSLIIGKRNRPTDTWVGVRDFFQLAALLEL